MPNFVEIAPTSTKVSLFFDFSRWRLPPSWLDFRNFKFLTVGSVKTVKLHHCAKFQGLNYVMVPNLIATVRPVTDIWRFSDFSRWQPPSCCVFEISNLTGAMCEKVNCIVMLHFVEISRTMARDSIFRCFNMASAAILNF